MSAETHQHGRVVGTDEVLDLLCLLLADGPVEDPSTVTLHTAGVDDEGLDVLWDTVFEEFAERTLGAGLSPGNLHRSMSLAEAAAVMAALLRDGGHGD